MSMISFLASRQNQTNVDKYKEVEKNFAWTEVKVQRVETKIFPGGLCLINQETRFLLIYVGLIKI